MWSNGLCNPLTLSGYFLPTIISTLGFKGYLGQLLTVPPNVFAMIIIIGNCLHSDHSKERIKHCIGGLIFVSTGYLLLAVVTNWRVRFFATFLIACTNAAVLPFLAHRTATVSGSTATALATGGVIAIANCGGIVAPFLFPSSTGPRYQMGNVSVFLKRWLHNSNTAQWTVFSMLVSTMFIAAYLGWRLGMGSDYLAVKQVAGESTNPDELRKRESVVEETQRRISVT